MFITTQNEIVSLMPTARWDRPEQLLGYLEEEERVALEPLLGTELYLHLCKEYKRLREKYVDITATTITPERQAKEEPGVPYADVTERLEHIHSSNWPAMYDYPIDNESKEVPEKDMQTVCLLRICQQIEFYKMLAHKAGLLAVSFNEGGGMNMVSAEGYEPADDKRLERVVKDAWMSASRAIDNLLIFLETDAKGKRFFTEQWQHAEAFWLHKDLLFQTARVLNEYLDIKGERIAYVALVRDIRFCQNTYLKPRIGNKLLKAVVEYANEETLPRPLPEKEGSDSSSSSGNQNDEVYDELLSLLRTALAFYVESRRTELAPVKEKLARRDSMTDAQQAMAAACEFIEENLDALGEVAVGTPIYNNVRVRKEQAERDAKNVCAARERQRKSAREQNQKKLFTGFPATHRNPEVS